MWEKLLKRFEEIGEEAAEAQAEMEAIAEADEFDQDAFDDVDQRISDLASERQTLELRMEKYKSRQLEIEKIRNAAAAIEQRESADGGKAPEFRKQMDDPYDTTSVRGTGEARVQDLTARAIAAVERTSDWEFESKASAGADRSKQRIVKLIEGNQDGVGRFAEYILAVNNPVYKRAFTKGITGREHMLTAPEREALSRAMGLTVGVGGYAVPMPIDPTLIQLGDGAIAEIRKYARVETTTVDMWRGLASTQLSASWDGEAAEVSDDTTTFTQPTIAIHKAQASVPASIEIAADYPNLVADLGALFADGKARLESSAYTLGDGDSKPYGVVPPLVSGALSSTGSNVLGAVDVHKLFTTIGPRYRQPGVGRQAWASNIATLAAIRQLGDDDNSAFTVDLTEGSVPAIWGRPWFELSDMDGTWGSGENYVLIFGDWTNYVIVDRVGMTIEFVPHLFATANNLPSGQRAWYAYWRTGANVVNPGAFELLNVT